MLVEKKINGTADRECQGLRGGWNRESLSNRHGVSIWEDEKALEMGGGDGGAIMSVLSFVVHILPQLKRRNEMAKYSKTLSLTYKTKRKG